MNIRLEEGCVVSEVLFYSLNGIERTFVSDWCISFTGWSVS